MSPWQSPSPHEIEELGQILKSGCRFLEERTGRIYRSTDARFLSFFVMRRSDLPVPISTPGAAISPEKPISEPRRKSLPLLPVSGKWEVPLAALCACAALAAVSLKAHPETLVMVAIFFAALVSSIAGFAFSAICGAMLFQLIDNPVRVVELMMVCSIGGQAWMTWALRHSIRLRPLVVFLAGGLFGLPVGFYILLHSDHVIYTRGIGILLILYAAYMLFRRPILWRHQHPLWDGLSGFVGGVTGGAAAFPGAFVTIWCGMKGWDKERQRALYQPFILVMQVTAIAILTLLRPDGAIAPSAILSSTVYLPAMLLGTMLGMTYFRRLNERQFFLAVNALLVISGLSLVV
jgi:uncharacterized membrane protein YfcA